MHAGELFAFMAIFRDLMKVFPKRAGEDDIEPMAKLYFRALSRFELADIQAGADAWTQRGKFFPKPAEWRDAIPRRDSERAALVEMTPSEAAEYLDAERRRFEGDPCSCRQCQGAGVTHRFLRFVPEQDEQGRDARALIGKRIVVRGHWAHGYELDRWYAARDRFWTDFNALVTRLSMSNGAKVEAEPEYEAESA